MRGNKEKKRKGCLIAILTPLLLILFLFIYGLFFYESPRTERKETKTEGYVQEQEAPGGFFDGIKKGYEYGKNAEKVSRNKYDHIQDGMTYEEVVEIFGCEGMLAQTLDLNGSKTEYYQWIGEGKGAFIQITFVDNVVFFKTATNLNGT